MRPLRHLLLVGVLLVTSIGAVAPTPAPDECASAGISDFDGDGHDDAVVGDPIGSGRDWRGGGRLFLLGGTADGLLNPRIEEFGQAPPGWTARAGHIDGDRCLDLVVANPFADGSAGADSVPSGGVAYIYWGGRDFSRATPLELKAPEGRTSAHFGWSIAVTDGTVAIGAPHEDADEIADSGAVYVFAFNGRTPAPAQRITQNTSGVPGGGEAGDMFGWSVALGRLGGNRDAVDLAVGAPFEDREEVGQADTGAVTAIYDVTTRPWTFRGAGWDLPLVTREVASRTGDHLGFCVAYGRNGNRGYLAASAPAADPGGVLDAGAVLLLETTDSADPRVLRVLRQETADVGDTPDERDRFGFSLAFSGSSLIVGVPGEGEPSVPESGAVQVVPLASAQGSRTVRESQPMAYDHLGWSVTATGDGGFLAGAPDRGTTGGFMMVADEVADFRLFVPGQGGFRPATGGLTDLGATMAG